MLRINNQRAYCIITGGVLFLFGLVGFAFKSVLNVSAPYLVSGLILGFWGIVISFI